MQENPGICWMFKKWGNIKKHIKNLADYAFIKSFVRDGVFISSDEKGVALCFRYDKKKNFLFGNISIG